MHRRLSTASNPDVLALHEGFATLCPDAAFHHAAGAGGTDRAYARQSRIGSMLGCLAVQFGHAIGNRGALAMHRHVRRERRLAAAQTPDPGAYQQKVMARTSAERSWWPRSSTPYLAIYRTAPRICCASTPWHRVLPSAT